MLKLETTDYPQLFRTFDPAPTITFDCPSCGISIKDFPGKYSNIAALTPDCRNCGTSLPRVTSLSKGTYARLQYHLNNLIRTHDLY